MSLVTAWIALPLLLGLLSLGCGLLVAYVAAGSIRGILVLPTGFALLIVLSNLATMSDATTNLATPLVVGCAIVGLGLTAPWRGYRPNAWGTVAVVAVFAAYAAPTVLSGQATFDGYISLDDTSTWLAITDQVMQHGRSLAGLQPSTYEAALNSYLSQSGYPAGSFLPLGIGGKLLGQDIAWLFQPTIAFAAAMLALGVYGLLDEIVASAPLRALAAFIAAQPALLYGYGVWSGIKELTSAALIALFAAQLAVVAQLPQDARRRQAIAMVLPLSVTIAAELDAVSAGGLAWLAPALAAAAVIAIRVDMHAFALRATSLVASSIVLSIPAIVIAAPCTTRRPRRRRSRALPRSGTCFTRSATCSCSASGPPATSASSLPGAIWTRPTCSWRCSAWRPHSDCGGRGGGGRGHCCSTSARSWPAACC